MKCAIVLNDKIVNLILADEAVAADELQRFAEAAGPGHTAEPLTAAQALTAWIGASRTADGWSAPVPAVLPADAPRPRDLAAELSAALELIRRLQDDVTLLQILK